MKLPKYDNRPGPGEPLYEDGKANDWDDIKFPLQIIGFLLAFGVCGWLIVTGLLEAVRTIFH